MPDGYTPVCDSCGIALCYDISEEEYQENKSFWDNWQCKECNPNYKGALKRFKGGKEMLDKLNGKQKTALVVALMRKIFAAESNMDLQPIAFKIAEDVKITFTPHQNSKGLRGFIHESGLLVLEQNPGKNTWCAALADAGVKCAWIMKNGDYLSFVLVHKGKVHIIRTKKNDRKYTEDKANQILAT
jgi:hypothetical protein